eukprot:scaffold442_cov268-Pinguiococcus_pyrenoidosus.AAC.49
MMIVDVHACHLALGSEAKDLRTSPAVPDASIAQAVSRQKQRSCDVRAVAGVLHPVAGLVHADGACIHRTRRHFPLKQPMVVTEAEELQTWAVRAADVNRPLLARFRPSHKPCQGAAVEEERRQKPHLERVAGTKQDEYPSILAAKHQNAAVFQEQSTGIKRAEQGAFLVRCRESVVSEGL